MHKKYIQIIIYINEYKKYLRFHKDQIQLQNIKNSINMINLYA